MIIMLLLHLSLAVQTQAQPDISPASGLRSVAWLTGCWEDRRSDRIITEHWMPPSGDDMIGGSTTVNGDSTLEFEFLRIHEGKKGTLTYIASPSGQKRTTFNLASVSANSVVFENLKHDFPQRIIYTLEDADHLTARVEGRHNGKEVAFSFTMKRISCDNTTKIGKD